MASCFAHRPPNNANKEKFFNQLTESLNTAINNYKNILLMGNLNINTLTQTNLNDVANYLTGFCDLFALSNREKEQKERVWYFTSSHQWCSVKKSVLRNFAKFTGKHLCQKCEESSD